MSQLKVIDSTAPGSFGLNTELPSARLPMEFARSAWNCVIGNDGRLQSRKALVENEDLLGTPPAGTIQTIYETPRADGDSDLVIGAGTELFQLKLGTSTWFEITPANVPTDGNWQFQSFNDILFATQADHLPEAFTRNVSQEWTTAAITMPSGAPTENFSVCHAAYGRIWMANGDTIKDIVYASELLNPLDFTAVGSGELNLNDVWTNGQDEVVAITSHSGYLIILGKKQTVIYQAPDDLSVTGFTLVEVINNVGCAARDSVVTVGDDIVWVAPQGLVSLGRLLQQKALPAGNLSRNVHFDFTDTLRTAGGGALKSAFITSTEDLVIVFASKGAWCFNTRRPTENGAAIATRWDQFPADIYSICHARDGTVWMGAPLGVMYNYTTYGSTAAKYKMRFYTGYLDFGSPELIKFLKKFAFVLKGASNQAVTFRWAFDYKANYAGATDILGEGMANSEYGVAEYAIAEYSGGETVEELRVNASRSGKLLQIGVESDIQGDAVAIYTAAIYATIGKTF